MKAPRLTKEQARQVRSLVEDGGWSKAEARELVLAGMGEPQPTPPSKPQFTDAEREGFAEVNRKLSDYFFGGKKR